MNTTNLVIIIGIIAIISLIAIIAVIGLPKPTNPPVIPPTLFKPTGYHYTPCSELCYNPSKNYSTKGYDPRFLALPDVKQACRDVANEPTINLGYCSVI